MKRLILSFWFRPKPQMNTQEPRNSSKTLELPWIFGFSKCLGVSVLHTELRHKLYGISLQIASFACLCLWVRQSNVFVERSLNGFVFGFVHTITTYNACVYTIFSWRNRHKVVEALKLLTNLECEGETKCDVFLTIFTWSTLLTIILVDFLLDQKDLLLLHLENVVYYFPLLQILMASNQFVGLVRLVEHRLDYFLARLKSSDAVDPDKLIKDYNVLYESCKLVNDTYSFPNLITVIRHGLGCAFTSYYLVMAALNLFPPSIVRKKLWLSSLSAVFFFCYIANIFKPCQAVQSKAKQFTINFYDKLSSDPAHRQLFASRPIYKKVKFTAFDVFTINYKAFNSIVTTLITYQVILLQFAFSSVDADV